MRCVWDRLQRAWALPVGGTMPDEIKGLVDFSTLWLKVTGELMHTNCLRVLTPALVLAGLSSAVIAATPVVVSNTSNLLPNTAGQTIQLFIAGTDQIAGENLNVQINNGTSGPLITLIDITDGTIFAGDNTGQGQGIITNSTIPGLQ